MTKNKVSSNSFFMLLYLSLLSSVFMYLSFSNVKVGTTDAVIRPLVFIVFILLFSIPTLLVYKQYIKKGNMDKKSENKFPFKIICILYGVVYFVAALRTLARFDLFASSELFPGSDMTFFILFFIVVCGVLSRFGINALSRGAVIFLFVVVCATGFVTITLLNEVDMLNFTPFPENGVFPFLEDSFLFVVQATELGTIVLFLDEIEGDIKKNLGLWSILSGISFAVILFFVVGSLGAFADTQLFPTYTAVTLANFGLLERVDALETAIWIICVVEKTSFYMLIVTKCVSKCLPKVKKMYISGVVTAGLATIILSVSNNVEKFRFVSYQPLIIGLFILSAVALPLALYFYMKRVKTYEKKQDM